MLRRSLESAVSFPLVIPFVGTVVGSVLAPLSLVLGALALRRTRSGGPWRKAAGAALAVGILASGFFVFWIVSGLYDEWAGGGEYAWASKVLTHEGRAGVDLG